MTFGEMYTYINLGKFFVFFYFDVSISWRWFDLEDINEYLYFSYFRLIL